MKYSKIISILILLKTLTFISCSSERKNEQAVIDLLPLFENVILEEARIDSINKYIIDSIQDQKTSFYNLYADYGEEDDEAKLLKLKNVVSSKVYDSLFIECINLQKLENKLTRGIEEKREKDRKILLNKVKKYLKTNEISKGVEVKSIINDIENELSSKIIYDDFPLVCHEYDGNLTVSRY
jgi:hypothetical protein